ncbi:COP9 signalosome complex subunit 5b [Nymphaea thermarum]|nr:COP9 signalosome complex subunit 5b [Nymphaea thermarum]
MSGQTSVSTSAHVFGQTLLLNLGLLKTLGRCILKVLWRQPMSPTVQEESQLAKISRDSSKITVEQVHGLMSQVIKDILFNSVRQSTRAVPIPNELLGPEPMVES